LCEQIVAVFLGRGNTENAGFTLDEYNSGSVDDVIGLVLQSTSFYYESGGQVSDTGVIRDASGLEFIVSTAQVYGGYVLHTGKLVSGAVRPGSSVTLLVDYGRRDLIAPNHTITHCLNLALRTVLLGQGTLSGQCEQKGSLVDPDKLRFDFSWGSALTETQIIQVENIVKQAINSQLPVYSEVVPLSQVSL